MNLRKHPFIWVVLTNTDIDVSSSVLDFTSLDDLLPVPDLERSVHTMHTVPYTLESVQSHKRGLG